MNVAYYKNQFMYDSYTFPDVDTRAYTLTLDADLITTESGREIPSAELTVKGDCPIQAGYQVIIPGIPHVYLVMEANFSESETRYVLHDAFAEVLSQKTLAISYDRSPLSPGAILTAIKDSIISSLQKRHIAFSVEEIGATSDLGFTSYGEAGQKLTDWLYETAKNLGATVYIQSQIETISPSEGIFWRVCKAIIRWDYRKTQTAPYSVIKKTEVTQKLISAEKNISITGRVQDSYANVTVVKSDSGYSPVGKKDFSAKTCLKYTGEILPAGSYYDLTSRADETLSFGKDEVITLADVKEWLSFYGTFQKPYFLMHNGFLYVSATTLRKTIFGFRNNFFGTIFIPYSAVGIDDVLGAEVSPATLTGVETGILTSWKNGLTVTVSGAKEGETDFVPAMTSQATEITYKNFKNGGYYPKSDFGIVSAGIRARMAILHSKQFYNAEPSISSIFFPLTTVWQRDFGVLDGSENPDRWAVVENLSESEKERIYSAPILHLHDLWRLPYLSMQAVKKISPKAPVETIFTPSEVDFSKLEVGDVVTPFGSAGGSKKVTATILSFEGGKWTKDAELE